MKTPKLKSDAKVDLQGLQDSLSNRVEQLNPLVLIVAGAVLLILVAVLFFTGGASQSGNNAVLKQAEQVIGHVSENIQALNRVLEDQQVQELAVIAAAEPEKLANLKQYVSGRIPDLMDLQLYPADLAPLRAADLGPFGYAVLDMLYIAAKSSLAPVQMHGSGDGSYIAMAVRVGDENNPTGYLFAKVKPDTLVETFKASLPDAGAFALDQYNGRFKSTTLSGLAKAPAAGEHIVWLRIPSSLFRVGLLQSAAASPSMGVLRPVLFVLGLVLLVLGVVLQFRPARKEPAVEPPQAPEEESVPAELQTRAAASRDEPGRTGAQIDDSASDETPQAQPRKTTGVDTGDGLGAIELPDLGFSLEKVATPRKKAHAPVELVESIFRAYDIRGIVDETLDEEVAYQVGQVVGTMTLEADAEPVVVARDGRASGPELVQGLIRGIASTGCDVVDIGAVPTGVLYFAAYDIGSASGVMVTGSHNPPEYNGIKMLIAGKTLAGDQIKDIYKRIKSGAVRVGKGKVSEQDMLDRYRERIASDIQLQRPLKVIADCGNGIGGVVVANVLRDIGAEVITLFDEVDGSFPNHHPDPSEPENLNDLIEAVRLMEADIGVAFDGDADRLGVVTSIGEIIYADRLMMLFAEDVLGRVPGATIIYDVKCTGHLHRVIEEAGGKAMMYKTGHSLIKNRMREIGAPFAGEMSGHFFFKERWYGFDCGIYSACRLLEILAKDERDPQQVLHELPNAVSTPELKVQMQEGENHEFIRQMQEHARFADARVTTIDGVRADFADGWGLVRASNTTPILVLRFEGDSEQSLQRIKEIFKLQMLAIKPDLRMPF
jgi:phosphomannomutase/phosphoglucomutase